MPPPFSFSICLCLSLYLYLSLTLFQHENYLFIPKRKPGGAFLHHILQANSEYLGIVVTEAILAVVLLSGPHCPAPRPSAYHTLYMT